ncbi:MULTISPECIES: hypothetical protein [Caballeronia]|uniref:hypothetical protein n=1 Tax=Caballeronia TaxID=1827195 RepID=UPI000AA4C88D|nr:MULTISPECIES: hypothetical protein [Caballeronia]
MKEEQAARAVLAILKEQGFVGGDVAHADDIVKPWVASGGGVSELNNALEICKKSGWLTPDNHGFVVTAAGTAA